MKHCSLIIMLTLTYAICVAPSLGAQELFCTAEYICTEGGGIDESYPDGPCKDLKRAQCEKDELKAELAEYKNFTVAALETIEALEAENQELKNKNYNLKQKNKRFRRRFGASRR